MTVRPRLEAAGADLERVWFADSAHGDWFTVAHDVERLAATVREHDVGLVIIDPISSHLSGTTDSHRDASVRAELSKLGTLAAQTRTAIVYVMHLRKGEGSALGRAAGSVAFTAMPRSVILLGPSRQNPHALVLAHAKCNVGALSKSRMLRLVPSGAVACVEWMGECAESADDLAELTRPTERCAPERQRAEDFLRKLLAAGPVAARRALEYADAEGITKNTLTSAKKAVRVRSIKQPTGEFVWSLPAEDPDVAPAVVNGGIIGIVGTVPDSRRDDPNHPAAAHVRRNVGIIEHTQGHDPGQPWLFAEPSGLMRPMPREATPVEPAGRAAVQSATKREEYF